MLAGDVDVINFFGTVYLFGDGADNAVEVRPNADGDVAVYGINETTINGRDEPMVIGQDGLIRRDLRVYLGGGNDSILIEGTEIGDDLTELSQVLFKAITAS